MIRCAAEMPLEVDLEDLFVQQRKEENLRRIVRRAKALLAADESFFGEKSANKRLRGKETNDRVAKSFVREFVRPEPESVLTVTDCFERYVCRRQRCSKR